MSMPPSKSIVKARSPDATYSFTGTTLNTPVRAAASTFPLHLPVLADALPPGAGGPSPLCAARFSARAAEEDARALAS